MNKKNALMIIKVVLLLSMIFLIFMQGQKEIRAIDFAKTIILVRSFPKSSLFMFFCFGLIGIAAMTLYDFIIVRHLKLNVKALTVFNVSFVANTINNISGLGGLTGASIRAIFFKKGINDSEDIIKYNLLLLPATGIGLSVMAIFSFENYKYLAPLIQDHKWLLAALIIFIIYLVLYFFIDKLYLLFKKQPYKSETSKLIIVRVKLLAVSVLEWGIAYLFFAILVGHFNPGIDLYGLFVVFTLASIAGIISLLPGGAGSYDLIVLLGLKYYGVSAEHGLAVLILYRTFYYFMPLAIGIIFTLILQLKNENHPKKLIKLSKINSFITQTSPITNLLLSILVFLSGIVLLISALIPGITERIKIAAGLLSFPILQWSHQLSICIGILLITISAEIGMKVKRAYEITFLLLILGALSTFFKGFDYEEAIFLGIVLLLLRMSKKSFYRKSLPFNWFWAVIRSIIALIGITIYIKMAHIILSDFLRKHQFAFISRKQMFSFEQRGAIIYVSLVIFFIFWHYSKASITKDVRYEKLDENRIADFLNNYQGHYLTHLIFLKDKHVFWAASNQVIIVYEKSHHVIVVLGDPIGNKEYFREAIAEFQTFIDEYGYKAAFYQVSHSLLSMYHDYGYSFFKLGETAIIDLNDFGLVGPKYRDFRNILSRFKRDGYCFEILEQKLSDDLYMSLKQISDEWLDGRKEMGFSLGWFDRTYLDHSPIAIIKQMETNEIIAFASIMPSYDNNQSASIDLMRFKQNVPSNTMMFLILNILVNYKEKGFKFFNLGMAPLSNVGKTRNAHFREKIAHIVCQHGNHFYSFDGLRKYKDKFDPEWEARYLAYDDLSLLPASLIEATLLIHPHKVKE